MEADGLRPTSRGITRRRLLQSAVATTTVGLAMPAVIARAQETTLSWLTWPGHADPSIVGPFEEATGIRIRAKEYGSGDLGLVEMVQNPGVYDVVTTSMEFIHQYASAGIIDELDPEEYPGWSEYLPELRADIGYNVDGKHYTIIYAFGFNALVYRTDKVTAEEAATYACLTDPKFKGMVAAQDWWGNSLGALSIAAGNSPAKGINPYVLNNDQFAKFGEYLQALRPQFGGFYEIAGIFSAFANGSMWLYPGGGDWAVQLLKDQGLPVESSIPDEGGYLWGEGISIVSSSAKKDAAKKFVDYLLSAEAQARVATKPSYSSIAPNGRTWTLLQQEKPEWAQRLKMHTFDDPCAITPMRQGKIAARVLPKDQTVEDWSNLWQTFKSS